jgi:hypothetical protein
MMRNNDMMRERILCLLYDHLRSDYSFAWSKQLFLGSGFSSHDLESIPPFRRDAKLEKLRKVLERIDKESPAFASGAVRRSMMLFPPMIRRRGFAEGVRERCWEVPFMPMEISSWNRSTER